MVLKTPAVRLGRRALAPPALRSTQRRLLSTAPATTTTTTTTTTEASEAPNQQSGLHALLNSGSSYKKKQKALNQHITILGADSAHEHRGTAWSSPHALTPGGKELPVATQYAEFQRIQKNTRSLGSRLERRYVPNALIHNPPRPEDVTLELLMASQTHLGHNKSLWNPANSRHIQGIRDGVHIISLETTAAYLRRAARVVEDVAYRGGTILFVGTRRGQTEVVTRAAELAGGCHLFTKWTPGAITNRDVILRAVELKVVNQADEELGEFDEFKKFSRPLMPDLVVCLNPMENYTMLYECGLKDIPTIGVIDTNADPTWVTYTIPANDDSLRSISVIGGVLGRAGEAGQKRRLADSNSGSVPWDTHPDLKRHMKKEIKAVLSKRKEVMGRMQSNVQGFTEEEERMLQSKYTTETADVSEADMMAMLGETAPSAEFVPAAEAADAKEASVADEAILAAAEEAVSAADAEVAPSVGAAPVTEPVLVAEAAPATEPVPAAEAIREATPAAADEAILAAAAEAVSAADAEAVPAANTKPTLDQIDYELKLAQEHTEIIQSELNLKSTTWKLSLKEASEMKAELDEATNNEILSDKGAGKKPE